MKPKPLYAPQEHTIGQCFCPDCYHFMERACQYVWGGYSGCPKCKSVDEPIVVDEMIAQSIILLNRKGYETKACCSGHLTGHSGYIAFYHDVDINLDDLPSFTFRLTGDYDINTAYGNRGQRANTFRWEVNGNTPLERLDDLLWKHVEIYHWVERLDTKGE